jgi:hypothetical protein
MAFGFRTHIHISKDFSTGRKTVVRTFKMMNKKTKGGRWDEESSIGRQFPLFTHGSLKA